MNQISSSAGITFAVDDVTPAANRLAECRAYEAVRATLESEIESCSDYHSMVVRDVGYQPLLAAVYLAFSEHRPLVLSPDALWITIAQGVAHHMAIHAESLRSRFVSHQGKLDLMFKVSGWVEGSPENPWVEAFANWAEQIRAHVGPKIHDALVCDFSTTGALERAVSQVVMMDVFQRFFQYTLVSVCGIPTVTLEGTTADWERLLDKVQALRIFDMDWWLDHLEPICEQLVAASRGEVNREHWRNICKLNDQYGGDIINGWVAKLFPYLRAFWKGPCSRRNPIFEKDGAGFQTMFAPTGLSRVPFTWRNEISQRERAMEVVAGLTGIAQSAQTMALRPMVGWVVRKADEMESAMRALRASSEHLLAPGLDPAKDAFNRPRVIGRWPDDLAMFHAACDGAELFKRKSQKASVRFLPAAQIEPLQWGRFNNWHRFAELADGTWLAINWSPEPGPFLSKKAKASPSRDREPCAICHCRPSTIGRPGLNPVVAHSFAELLDGLLKSDGRPYWLEAGFEAYGDAERYTRIA